MTVWLFGKRMDGYHCIEEDLIVYLVHTVYPGIFSCCTDITLISLGFPGLFPKCFVATHDNRRSVHLISSGNCMFTRISITYLCLHRLAPGAHWPSVPRAPIPCFQPDWFALALGLVHGYRQARFDPLSHQTHHLLPPLR